MVLDIGTQKTTFSYKDYRLGAKKLERNMDNLEFIRRFSMHYLSRISRLYPEALYGSIISASLEVQPKQ